MSAEVQAELNQQRDMFLQKAGARRPDDSLVDMAVLVDAARMKNGLVHRPVLDSLHGIFAETCTEVLASTHNRHYKAPTTHGATIELML